MPIRKLGKPVSSQMVASAGISNPKSVIKELLENSIDACDRKSGGQIFIEVDDNSGGLEYISIRDNGSGVDKADRNIMFLNHTTSKIESYEDLGTTLSTCGFRGEALHFICQMSDSVQITSRTSTEQTAEYWSVGNTGLLNGSVKRMSAPIGTTIKIKGLFKNTPVRYKFLQKEKKKTHTQIRDMIFSYALIYQNIRFQLKFVRVLPNGNIVSNENFTFSNNNTVQLMRNELNIRNTNTLFKINTEFSVKVGNRELYQVKLEGVFPKGTASDAFTVKRPLKIINLNDRPLDVKLSFGKALSKEITETFNANMLISPQIWYLHLMIPNEFLDINIEPEKSDVLVNNEELMLAALKECLKVEVEKVHQINKESFSPVQDTKTQKTLQSLEDFEDESNEDESIISTLNSVVKNVQKSAQEAFGIHSQEILNDYNEDSALCNDTFEPYNNNENQVNQQENNIHILAGEKGSTFVEDTTVQMVKSGVAKEPLSTSPEKNMDSFVLPEKFTEIEEVASVSNAQSTGYEEKNDNNEENSNLNYINDGENGEWSKSMFDDTSISSEADEITSDLIIDDEYAKESNKSILNPWVITEMVNDMKNKSQDYGSAAASTDCLRPPEVENLSFQTAPNLETKKITNESVSIPKPVSGEIRESLGSYVTHNIDLSPKKKVPKIQSQIPMSLRPLKVIEMAQHMENKSCSSEFVVLDSVPNIIQFEEYWSKRGGYPSDVVVDGLMKIYQTLNYNFNEKEIVVSKHGITKLI